MPLFFHGTLEKLFARLRSHGMILKRQFPEEIDENVQPCHAECHLQPEHNRAAWNTACNLSANRAAQNTARNLSYCPQPERNRAVWNTARNPSATVLCGIPPATRAQPCCAEYRLQPERNRAARNTAHNPSATVLCGIPPATRAQPVLRGIAARNPSFLLAASRIILPKPNPPRNALKNALILGHWCQGSNIQNGTMGHPPNFSVPPAADDPGYDETRGRGPFWMSVHLDTRPPGPGIYTSWESCRAAGEWIRGGGTRHYTSRVDCLQVWHARCAAGEHDHPPTASAPAPPYTGGGPSRPSAASAPAPPYTESALPISFAGLNLSSSPPRTSQPTPVHAAPHTPPRNSSGTPLRAAPHTPLHTPPSAPIFYAVQGGSIVHRSYGAAYRQLGRMREADPSHTLHASPDHVYTALIVAGLEPDVALTRAATTLIPHCPPETADARAQA
ncbi:hypothetical protein B0H14DRAFT_2607001 [Mycena olivaceomarginata]|nr:hypothetical protein B0H14DRAFT_2607001 [Mycena olivaceomarginata]